jgi:flotillin
MQISLFAADFSPGTLEFFLVLICIATVMLVFIILFLVIKYYRRCPSNRILVIYGRTRTGNAAKCIHGGAALVVPLVQDYAYLNLEPMQIEVPLRGALSIENIRVNVPSVFTVAIGTTPEIMQNAAIRLLGQSADEITKQAEEIIFGQLRQVIASMKIEDINRDRETFLQHIQNSLEPELRKIGLVLINVNITDITDESGYIDAIGQKAASEAIQKARGDVAEELRKGEIRVAEADRDKVVQVASATKEREVGVRDAARDQAIRIADLDKSQQIGEQTAAYQRQSQIKVAEQQMRVQMADADAKAIDGENIAKAVVAASKAELAVKEAEAMRRGEISRRQAEAAVLEAQNVAMAKAAIAEAAKIEAERRAQLEAPAKAEKARIVVDAEAAAEKRRIEAEGDAKAIFARLDAEARGQYEILAKKGEGLKAIIDACGGAEQAFQLLMLEHLDNMADTAAKAISNIKFDKVVVWENGQNGKSATSSFLQNMAYTLPPMMQVMKEIGGLDLPETLVKMRSATAPTSVPSSATDGMKPLDGVRGEG